MRSATRARAHVTAFCVMLLAVLGMVWYASTLAPDNAVISGNYTPVGNNFARFSSGKAELLSRTGEVISSVEFDYPDRALTAAGSVAAAWEPGGSIAFLGEGGAKLAREDGLLGLFGSESGAVSMIVERSGRAEVVVYGAPGVRLELTAGSWPIAAVISPHGDVLAILSPEEGGMSVTAYSLPGSEELWHTTLSSPQFDLEWIDDAALHAFRGGGDIYIDGYTGEIVPQGSE